MNDNPSPTVVARSNDGRFAVGNKLAIGNPHARTSQRLRSAMLRAVTATDIEQVIQKLIELAKSGEIPAAKLLLDRVLGKEDLHPVRLVRPIPCDDVDAVKRHLRERIAALGLIQTTDLPDTRGEP